MIQLKYKVTINYRDYDNSKSRRVYNIFAKSKSHAENIAREMFFMEFGVFKDMYIDVQLKEPSTDEVNLVLEKVKHDFIPLISQIKGMSYKKFIRNIEDMDAFSIQMKDGDISYMFNILDLTCKLMFINGKVLLDDSSVIVKLNNGMRYFVTNNLSDVYYTLMQ